MKCTKCGSTKNVIRHHEQYKEIHGEDKIVMLCISCHNKLHIRLRKDGKCKVPAAEIEKYSNRAYQEEYRQRPEVKERVKVYNQRPEVKEKRKEHCQKPEVKEQRKEYLQKPEVKERIKVYHERTPEKLDAIMDQYFSGDYTINVKLTEKQKNSNLNTTARMKQKEEEARVRNEKIDKRQMRCK